MLTTKAGGEMWRDGESLPRPRKNADSRAAVVEDVDVGEVRLCGCGVRDGCTRKYMGSHSLLLDETSIVNVHSRYA